MMVIGVTGGVGTGKSSILDYLRTKYKATVLLADDIGRDLMEAGEVSYQLILSYFGDDILQAGPGSEIDRNKLSAIVFHDEEKLKMLNSFVHPYVRNRILEKIDQYKASGCHMIVVESAILIQAGYQDMIDELWVVHTDYETRVKRLAESRGYSREKTDSIISKQMPDAQMEAQADLVIDNSYDREYAYTQIDNYLNHAGNNNR